MSKDKSGFSNTEFKRTEFKQLFPNWILFCYFIILVLLPIQTPISVVISSLKLPSFLSLWKEALASVVMIWLTFKILKISYRSFFGER